jgi:phosphoglycolate phosphatase
MAAVQAVIFDLDGTLVDSAEDIIAALNRGMAAASRAPVAADAARRIISMGLDRMLETALEASGGLPDPGELARVTTLARAFYDEHLLVRTRPYDGIIDVLSGLREEGVRLGVCTNKLAAPAQHVLTGLGLESFFDIVIGRDSVAHRKPHPAPLLAALEGTGARHDTAVMVGDSGIDVACARAADVPVIVMGYGYGEVPAEELGADLVAGVEDLPRAIAALGRGRRSG